MRFLKYLLLCIAILLTGLIVAAAIGLHYLRGVPGFYKAYNWTYEERGSVAQRAYEKLIPAGNMASAARAAEIRLREGRGGDGMASDAVTVVLSEEEVNAAIRHTSEFFKATAEKYEEYLKNPGVFFQDGCIILAGESSGYIVSFYFRPAIDDEGRLRLDLVKATGGRLALPRAFLNTQMDKLCQTVEAKMPEWQKEATMDDTGVVNRAAVAAASGNLLVCALSNKSAPAVLFMPEDYPGGKRLLPVKIVEVRVGDEDLTLKLAPMDKAAREKMFAEVAGK